MTKIETQVMASVGVIYAVRKLLGPTALKLYALTLSLAGVTTFASVPSVLHNFQSVAVAGPGSVALFVVYAVLGTTIIVQFALAVGATAAISLFVSGVRAALSGRTATA
ncbi:MAG TPA: hypothetical protein VHD37_03175 [Candidatus Paceibacterota bacterium]|nr:hypothetical protein [Candidatus Paceibacterota bacterium]